MMKNYHGPKRSDRRRNTEETNNPEKLIVSYTIQLVIVVCYTKIEASSCCIVPEISLIIQLVIVVCYTKIEASSCIVPEISLTKNLIWASTERKKEGTTNE